MGAKDDCEFRISDLVKTLLELIFKPCGEFRWSAEGPVSQIHSLHLLVGAPGIFSDLLRVVQMLKRESRVRKATGSYRTYSSLVNCNLGSWVCNGRPAFRQNCTIGAWVCSERTELILQPFRDLTYVTAHSPSLPSLYLGHNTFSILSVASPTLQLILQPFFRFSHVTGSSFTSSCEPPI